MDEWKIFGFTFSQEQIGSVLFLYGGHAVMAVLILMMGWVVARLIRKIAVRIMRKAGLEEILVNFLANILYGLLLAFVFIAALNQLGIQTASLIAVLGAAGLAIGLALQGSLSNFASGIMIILFKHFKIGDVISTGGITGIVRDMNIFTTTLYTFTNEKVLVPNNQLTTGVLTNITANNQRRIDLMIAVDYEEDISRVAEALDKVVKDEPRILSTPVPYIGLENLGMNGVEFALRVWVKTGDWGDARRDLLVAVKQTFDREGVTLYRKPS